MSEWYLSKGDGQEGPMTAKQIAALVAARAFRASEAFAWKEGMPEWRTVAQSGVLAEAATGLPRTIPTTSAIQNPQSVPTKGGMAAVAEQAGRSSKMASSTEVKNPYSAPRTKQVFGRLREEKALDYEGMGRLNYFLGQVVLTVVVYGLMFLQFAVMGFDSLFGGLIFVSLIGGVVGLYLATERVKNLGMSGWAVLWCFVPIVSIWMTWRMIACPSGYDDHRELDKTGKVITALIIGFFVLTIVGTMLMETRSVS